MQVRILLPRDWNSKMVMQVMDSKSMTKRRDPFQISHLISIATIHFAKDKTKSKFMARFESKTERMTLKIKFDSSGAY